MSLNLAWWKVVIIVISAGVALLIAVHAISNRQAQMTGGYCHHFWGTPGEFVGPCPDNTATLGSCVAGYVYANPGYSLQQTCSQLGF